MLPAGDDLRRRGVDHASQAGDEQGVVHVRLGRHHGSGLGRRRNRRGRDMGASLEVGAEFDPACSADGKRHGTLRGSGAGGCVPPGRPGDGRGDMAECQANRLLDPAAFGLVGDQPEIGVAAVGREGDRAVGRDLAAAADVVEGDEMPDEIRGERFRVEAVLLAQRHERQVPVADGVADDDDIVRHDELEGDFAAGLEGLDALLAGVHIHDSHAVLLRLGGGVT